MKPGDIVIAAFPGAQLTKARPAVVLSTPEYHQQHPDVVLGLIPTKPPGRLSATDCEIRDWKEAGLHAPSCFRLYVVTLLRRDVRAIGRLTEHDWEGVKSRRSCRSDWRLGSGRP